MRKFAGVDMQLTLPADIMEAFNAVPEWSYHSLLATSGGELSGLSHNIWIAPRGSQVKSLSTFDKPGYADYVQFEGRIVAGDFNSSYCGQSVLLSLIESFGEHEIPYVYGMLRDSIRFALLRRLRNSANKSAATEQVDQ